MRILILAVVILFGASLIAQEARVIHLDPAISKEAKEKWNALQMAQANWDTFQRQVKEDYTVVSEKDKDAGSSLFTFSGTACLTLNADNILGYTPCPVDSKEPERRSYRKGWESGFTFSNDFQYIVPSVPSPQIKGSPSWSWPNCGWIGSGSVQYN